MEVDVDVDVDRRGGREEERDGRVCSWENVDGTYGVDWARIDIKLRISEETAEGVRGDKEVAGIEA